jgi:N,N'-diacetyllegionaminate synthase
MMAPTTKLFGQDRPCYIIAEVGINHNGDIDLACKLIDMAADAGADAVKFQNFRTEDFIADRSLTYTYSSLGSDVTEPQWDMFKRYEFTGERLAGVASYCVRRHIDFASTPTSVDGVLECVRLGAAFMKNGSDFLTHLPLIKVMAGTGLPTLLSTGMSTVAEIDDAVRAFRDAGGRDLVLMHCVSLYPAPIESLALRRIPVLARTFGCPVGYSDHSEGVIAAAVAVALGAVAVERHITLDKSMPGSDHRFSADAAEFRALVAAVRAAQSSLGNEQPGLGEAEAEARQQHRLSCVAASRLSPGAILAESDVVFRRPGTGVPPNAVNWLIGRKLRREVASGHVFKSEDFL